VICETCHGYRFVMRMIDGVIPQRIPCPDCVDGFANCCEGPIACNDFTHGLPAGVEGDSVIRQDAPAPVELHIYRSQRCPYCSVDREIIVEGDNYLTLVAIDCPHKDKCQWELFVLAGLIPYGG
jgi:hypothetical protein